MAVGVLLVEEAGAAAGTVLLAFGLSLIHGQTGFAGPEIIDDPLRVALAIHKVHLVITGPCTSLLGGDFYCRADRGRDLTDGTR
jgi:hypothetical protein